MEEPLRAALERALGGALLEARPVGGGDINDAWSIRLVDGSRAFAKSRPNAPADFFSREAAGLDWLRDADALRVPRVLAVGESRHGTPGFLALEWLESRARSGSFDEQLGFGLAALHRSGAAAFGFEHDNYIGSLPQSNRVHERWVDFFRDERLEPQLRLAIDAGRLSQATRRRADRLLAGLDARLGVPEPPARLHGDLWSGNLLSDERGAPCLIDPAVYGGHREVDLAMMRLFGGFGERTFAAYAERHPLAPDADERLELYQLYPRLVHVNLFGGSYTAAVDRAVARLVG